MNYIRITFALIVLSAVITVIVILVNRARKTTTARTDPSPAGGGHGSHEARHGSSHSEKTGMGFWGILGRVLATIFVLSLAVNISLCGFRWYNDTNVPITKAPIEYPASGTGRATKRDGVKAYLNPRKAYTRPSGPAKYVFVGNPSLFFDDTEGEKIDRTPKRKDWWDMPPGEYLVYPLEGETLDFTWWHKD